MPAGLSDLIDKGMGEPVYQIERQGDPRQMPSLLVANDTWKLVTVLGDPLSIWTIDK